ncbi:MAG: lytic transglycosylase domain-containing protein [Spirochaetaceae bacterium]|nr:lytic transglycosylase domain-containing protein [Spirochaetaceae bacterium]
MFPDKSAVFLLFFSFLAFGSCGAKGVMEITRDEAAKKIKKGDITFILHADLSGMNELSRLDPSSPFYAGLLVESAGDTLRAAHLFEAALDSPIPKVKREAARKLIPLLAEFKDKEQAERIFRFLQKNKSTLEELITLNGAALYVLGRYAEALVLFPVQGKNPSVENIPEKIWEEISLWNSAFRLMSLINQQKSNQQKSNQQILPAGELRAFFFNSTTGAAYRWAYEELLRTFDYALPVEDKAAIAGRLAVSGNVYPEALLHFSGIKDESLFLMFNPLLNDLGRAYAAVAAKREEGFKLLGDWESAIRTGKNSPLSGLSAAEQNAVRYSLLFYEGRIRRQQGKHGEAVALFTRALALTRDAVQEDACIWYILNSSFTEKPENVPELIKTYAPRWHDDDDFYDIMDKLTSYLVTEKKWADLADVFFAIRNGKDGATKARIAYLLGRAVSLGYLSGRSARNMTARDFFTIAYEQKDASFYYRALAASKLEKNLTPVENRTERAAAEPAPRADELEFFVKFFEYGAASYANAYLRENAGRYTKQELRIIARTFAASGLSRESIQITGIFMRRENYVMETADLELYYPWLFSELIEKNALTYGLHPSLYFGLIRTESAFVPGIVSSAGAVGLAQFMPSTAKEVAAQIKRRGGPDYAADGAVNLTDPEINTHMGAVYLSDLIDSMGSPMLALMGYNGGPARIRRLRRAAASLPEDIFVETVAITETRNYGKRVMAAAAAYGYLYYGLPMHKTVSEIYK